MKRKIKFYSLKQKQVGRSYTYGVAESLKGVLNYINTLDIEDKAYTIERKTCFISNVSFDEENDLYRIIFKSASSGYRSDLIDVRTLIERPNPKNLTEGEGEMTHAIIKFESDDCLLLLETNGKGVGIKKIVNYFKYIYNNHKQDLGEDLPSLLYKEWIVAHENLQEVLNKLNRIKTASVFVEKSVLGSDTFNFSGRTQNVKDVVELKVSADYRKDIKAFAIETMSKFLAGTTTVVNKIRIEGTDENNANSIIDTEILQKVDSLVVEVNNATGEVSSVDILNKIENLL
ncbi:hypothetical protein [Winogradskyella sp.]|jgi:hypothetical protein|uniref:hypothetical protein n=1 Tax=Winogradskyella sp. TaxID=1883156 RepID=UPI0025F147BA|nr:hypothetical protein [Winogradskyella sp.]MCT4630189.1 hypothetical protein [Winogradskyella sp.]